MKTKKIVLPDQFEAFSDYIKCTSGKSGDEYTITIGHCTCHGFSFHKECRHYDEAEAKGLIDKLKSKKISSFNGVTVTDSARVLRKQALKEYFTKKSILFTDELINKIEPEISNKSIQEVLEMAVEMSSHEIVSIGG